MPIVVQKYGGSSVADPEKIQRVAERIATAHRSGTQLVVVVSAMGDTTDDLLKLAQRITSMPPRRELDMLLSAGERIAMALLAMALESRGVAAVSFTGSQCGIITNDAHTNARIIEVRPFRVVDELSTGKVVIVAGYQGVSYRREVTTLGRGGSDTTAVALAAALDADCEIYSDVPGVFTADPRLVPAARRLDEISYEEMQELAEAGARVLNSSAVEFAKERGIAIYARSTFAGPGETVVRRFPPKSPGRVVGIASERDIVLLQLRSPEPLPALTLLLDAVERHGGSGRQLHMNRVGSHGGVSLVLPLENLHAFPALRDELQSELHAGLEVNEQLGTVSAIGAGMNASVAPLRAALAALSEQGVEVSGIATSSFRISLLVPRDRLTDSVRALHRRLIPEQLAHPADLS